jgi:hypothetical protein
MKINGKDELLARFARRALLLASLLAMALICATPGRAQSSGPSATALAEKPPAATATATQAPNAVAKPSVAPANVPERAKEKPSAKGTQEGIKVHGHWTIEVKNPDGTVVTRREFENSLAGPGGVSGANTLAGLLSGNYVVGPWGITLFGSPGPCSTATSTIGPGTCVILSANATGTTPGFTGGCMTTPAQASPQPFCYATLNESLGGTANGLFSSFALSGSAYSDQTASITRVTTNVELCRNLNFNILVGTAVAQTSVSANACLTTNFGTDSVTGTTGAFTQFTSTTLASSIPVGLGQIVQATVVISFQ